MRHAWLRIISVGLVAAVLSFFVFALSPEDGGAFDPGFGSPVTAFEFAQTPEDVAHVFGAVGDPAREARIASMRKGVYADFPFIVAFGAFIALFFFAASKQSGRSVWLVFAIVGIVAALADMIEDVILLGILSDPVTAPLVSVLAIPVYIKFGGLGVANIAAGRFMTRQSGLLPKGLGVIAILGGLLTLAGLAVPRQLVWVLSSAVAAGWIAMLVYAVSQWLAREPGTPARAVA